MGQNLAYFNGRFIELDEPVLSIEERGLQFGDGIYEMLRIYDGHPYTLTEHIERLSASAEAILLELPVSKKDLVDLVYNGITRSGIQEGTVYIQITRGSSPRNHLFPQNVAANLYLIWKEGVSDLTQMREQGITTRIFEDERWSNCYIKSLCLLPNVLAKEKAHRQGAHEALFVREGKLKEGSSTNVFIVKDGIFFTPVADRSILNGITRQKMMELLRVHGVRIEERDISVAALKDADEVLVTSSIQEALPVVQVDETVIGAGVPGPYFKKLLMWYKEEVQRAATVIEDANA
ncbi:D-amino-acid transaminase [Aneurinibacillus sp. REN35]|uniref:D-amino-acid transaminase n=1 Tax=Aneurinibacillus sp. REN35 TaxID=3237286 RepID=UPI0035296D0B